MQPASRHAAYFRPPSEEPIGTLNTTPLIDVMLVLLIMFIVTIPISTHKVGVDLPQATDGRTDPVVHRIDIDAAGRIFWNGAAVAGSGLPPLLAEARAQPLAEVHLRADGETPYVVFDEVLADVKRAGIEQLGIIDNERFANAN